MKETLLNSKFELDIQMVEPPLIWIVLPNDDLVCGTNFNVVLLNEGYSYWALNHRQQIYVSVGQKKLLFYLI